jgi:hypothetical protein
VANIKERNADNATTLTTVSLFSQIGSDYGDPKQYDRYQPRVISLPGNLNDTSIALQIQGARNSTPLQVDIASTGNLTGEYRLSHKGRTVGTIKTQELDDLPKLSVEHGTYTSRITEVEDRLTGYSLAHLASSYSDQVRWIEFSLDVYRESRYRNNIGFALVSRSTGSVLDPLTGSSLASIDSTNYLKILADNAVFETYGSNDIVKRVNFWRFKVGGDLNLSDTLMVPFIATEGESKFIATTSKSINGGNQQIKWSDNSTICFEDLRRGMKDFDDGIIIMKDMIIRPDGFWK